MILYDGFYELFFYFLGDFNWICDCLITTLSLACSILVIALPFVAIYKIVRLFV